MIGGGEKPGGKRNDMETEVDMSVGMDYQASILRVSLVRRIESERGR